MANQQVAPTAATNHVLNYCYRQVAPMELKADYIRRKYGFLRLGQDEA